MEFLIFCSLLVKMATAGFVLEIKAISYKNPEHRAVGARSSGYCDYVSWDECDNYFTFCVKQYPQQKNCGIGKVKTAFYDNSDDLSFSKTPNRGFANPLVFIGKSLWPGSLSLTVGVDDWDPWRYSPDEHVDDVTVYKPMQPSPRYSRAVSYRGANGYSEIVLRFRLRCLSNYYGPHCFKFCRLTNSNRGHYYCTSYGNKRCLSGWKDVRTNCTRAACRLGCNVQPGAGSCTRPGECTCENNDLWTGELCDQCVPRRGCSATGYCVIPGECICRHGYIGANCDINATICDQIHSQEVDRDQCLNMSSCSEEIYDECINQNSCVPNPCNNGACIQREEPDGEGYECDCEAGWTGAHCDVNIDECQSQPCLNNGTCVDLVDGYSCQCSGRWGGENCSVNYYKCYEDTCQNEATCEELPGGFECDCESGYTGELCEMDLNECLDSDTCNERGTCTNLFGGYNCSCSKEYQGRNCEIDLNMCRSSPCLNGGACTSLENDYTCLCSEGFTGDNCQLASQCTTSTCVNGTCRVVNESLMCLCAPGFTGQSCDTAVPVTAATRQEGTRAVLVAGWLVALLLSTLLVLLIVMAAIIITRDRKRLQVLKYANEPRTSSADLLNRRHSLLSDMSRSFDNTLYQDTSSITGLVQESESREFDNPLYSDYKPFRPASGSTSAERLPLTTT